MNVSPTVPDFKTDWDLTLAMASTDWRPDDWDPPDDRQKFGDALAALAVDDVPDIDPVEAVRESREDV